MVKKKSNKPDAEVPIPFIVDKDKDEDPKEKSVVVKLTTNLAGETLPNPTTEFQPIFNRSAVEQYFKWISSVHNIMGNHTIRNKYAVALKMLKGSYRDMWLAKCNTTSQSMGKHVVGMCPIRRWTWRRNAWKLSPSVDWYWMGCGEGISRGASIHSKTVLPHPGPDGLCPIG
jgi:hypothetical protein